MQMPEDVWIGTRIMLTAPSSVSISMLPGEKKDQESEALGYSKGGYSTKVHLRTDGNGKLILINL